MLRTEVDAEDFVTGNLRSGGCTLEKQWLKRLDPGEVSRMEASLDAAIEISVIIPTLGRPVLAERAVRSALSQSYSSFEVVVVIDGPDAETAQALGSIRDQRLRLVQLEENAGGGEARNIGVRFARGRWVALLDDDDEWLPGKLKTQWEIGLAMASEHAIVAGRFIERSESGERVLPGRAPAASEAFSDYLFARRGWHSGEGFLQTSTWLVTRPLMLKVPFTRGLKRCQDLDWLLHATALPNVEVRVAPQVLAIFNHDEDRVRVSRAADWRFLYSWALSNKQYFTRRAFSYFVATFCVPSAAKEREGLSSFVFLVRSCLVHGNAGMKCWLLFILLWCVPEERRRELRARYARLRTVWEAIPSGVHSRQVPRKASL